MQHWVLLVGCSCCWLVYVHSKCLMSDPSVCLFSGRLATTTYMHYIMPEKWPRKMTPGVWMMVSKFNRKKCILLLFTQSKIKQIFMWKCIVIYIFFSYGNITVILVEVVIVAYLFIHNHIHTCKTLCLVPVKVFTLSLFENKVFAWKSKFIYLSKW